MAAAKKPLEFHAKRPWGPDRRTEDSDEDDEDDNEAENGFSMEEVLRLGGTKVMALNSRRRGSGPGSGPARGRGGAEREGVRRVPSVGKCSVRLGHHFFSTALYMLKV